MYALYLTAVPDELSEGYDLNKSYPIIFTVNTLSKGYAIEKAEKVLRENHWKNIDIQKIGIIPKDKQGESPQDESTQDYKIFVFPNAAKNSRIQNFVSKIKTLFNK